jgi:hypothetical protein
MGGGPSAIINAKDMRCQPKKYFNKINPRYGSLIDNLRLECNDGQSHDQGGPGGHITKDFFCAQGFDEIKARVGGVVDGMQIRCSDGRWSEWYGGYGGTEQHSKKCADKKQVITGLTSVGTRDNMVMFLNDFNNSIECGDRVDCQADENVFHIECKNRTDDEYKGKMKEYCNRNNENARNSGCIDWCSRNDRDCVLLNTLNDCQKYGITEGECNSAKVASVNADCQKNGILSTQGMNMGYQCNLNSLAKFKTDCEELGIDTNICTPDAIQSEKDRKLQRELVEEQQRRADEKYKQTQDMIANMLGGDTNTNINTNTPKEIDEETETLMYIGIGAAILILLSSSSASVIAMNRKN